MPTATTSKPAADSAPDQAWKPELHEIPLDAIETGTNVRAGAGDVTALRDSIKSVGMLEPIRVAQTGAGTYELIYGQRRLEASRAAGRTTILAIVVPAVPSSIDRTVAQLVENLHRDDLNAVDAAKAYREILDAGLTQRELAALLGIAQPTIANTLALLKAPDELQARVAAGELTRSHVEAIVRLPKAEQAEVARRVVEHGLSTRDVENEIALAEQRQAEADRERNRAEADAKKIDAALRKAEASDDATVLVWGTGTPPLAAALKALGWVVKVETTWPAAGGEECDCQAWRAADYADGHTHGKFSVNRVCVSKKHEAVRSAAIDADRQANEKRWAKERADTERRRQEEQAAAVKQREAVIGLLRGATATYWASAAGVDLQRLLLVAVISEDPEDLFERRVAEDDREGLHELDDPLWSVIGELDAAAVHEELGEVLADALIDQSWAFSAGARAKLIELATPPAPKPAKQSKAKG
jgi:ParB family chromosome partitioning protein